MKNEPSKIDNCHHCRALVAGHRFVCTDCERRESYGKVIETLWDACPRDLYAALDALTWTWTLRKREIVQRRREAIEDQREAQRSARDAFAAGRYAGEMDSGLW